MQRFKSEIKKGVIVFSTHQNSPSADILNVLKESEKAIFVKSEETGKTCWLPKSAFEEIELTKETNYPAFTLKKWFRQSLIKKNEDWPFIALGLVS